MNNHHLDNWVTDTVKMCAIPLTETHIDEKFIIHYYLGFDITIATAICIEMFQSIELRHPVHIYLYIIDYPHDHSTMNRIGSNNGYMQKCGEYYSIVVYRKLFWPKVLIHEILHVLWISNCIPMNSNYPKWDEAIIEAEAVRQSIQKGYINASEYRYYLDQSKRVIAKTICGGGNKNNTNDNNHIDIKIDNKTVVDECLSKQKTALLEYIFLSDTINDLVGFNKNYY